VADITREGERVASLVRDFTNEGLKLRLATRADDHLGAGASKQLCGCPSDAGARTRYDRHLALEINHATSPQIGVFDRNSHIQTARRDQLCHGSVKCSTGITKSLNGAPALSA